MVRGCSKTNDDELALKFRMMREHGSSRNIIMNFMDIITG